MVRSADRAGREQAEGVNHAPILSDLLRPRVDGHDGEGACLVQGW